MIDTVIVHARILSCVLVILVSKVDLCSGAYDVDFHDDFSTISNSAFIGDVNYVTKGIIAEHVATHDVMLHVHYGNDNGPRCIVKCIRIHRSSRYGWMGRRIQSAT